MSSKFIELSRFDLPLMRLPVVKLFAAVGVFSYSLYLTHTFSIGIVNQVVKAAHLPESTLLFWFFTAIIAAIGFGWCFWYVCERPFLSRHAKQRVSQEKLLS